MNASPILNWPEAQTESIRRRTVEKTDHRHRRCCARAASGHTTAVPPSSVINSRRLI
jgi:hypothetical protein